MDVSLKHIETHAVCVGGVEYGGGHCLEERGDWTADCWDAYGTDGGEENEGVRTLYLMASPTAAGLLRKTGLCPCERERQERTVQSKF